MSGHIWQYIPGKSISFLRQSRVTISSMTGTVLHSMQVDCGEPIKVTASLHILLFAEITGEGECSQNLQLSCFSHVEKLIVIIIYINSRHKFLINIANI